MFHVWTLIPPELIRSAYGSVITIVHVHVPIFTPFAVRVVSGEAPWVVEELPTGLPPDVQLMVAFVEPVRS